MTNQIIGLIDGKGRAYSIDVEDMGDGRLRLKCRDLSKIHCESGQSNLLERNRYRIDAVNWGKDYVEIIKIKEITENDRIRVTSSRTH